MIWRLQPRRCCAAGAPVVLALGPRLLRCHWRTLRNLLKLFFIFIKKFSSHPPPSCADNSTLPEPPCSPPSAARSPFSFYTSIKTLPLLLPLLLVLIFASALHFSGLANQHPRRSFSSQPQLARSLFQHSTPADVCAPNERDPGFFCN